MVSNMNTASIPVSMLITTLQKPLLAYYQDEVLAQQYAWWLLSALTGKTKSSLLALGRLTVSSHDYQTLQEWVIDLTIQHKPIAYILGTMPFAELTISCQSPVLIPRPETEEWVNALIERLRPFQNQSLTILDIGTGTGCIALALAYALPESKIVAIDISETALELARENAQLNAIDNVSFIRSDLFADLPDMYFDIIVSNPPYISAAEWDLLEPSVKGWEDVTALISEDSGLGMIKKIIAFAPSYIKPSQELLECGIPNLIIEVGHQQGGSVVELFQEQGFSAVTIDKDAAGKERVVKGQLHGVVWQEE